MTGGYGDRVGPQGRVHYPAFTRGCYYGWDSGRKPPCLGCSYGVIGKVAGRILHGFRLLRYPRGGSP